MPPVSQAQRRWAFANKDKPGKEGAAAKEFADADPGGKLPERKRKKSKMYSEESRRKMRA
jgi:hypothetical protein